MSKKKRLQICPQCGQKFYSTERSEEHARKFAHWGDYNPSWQVGRKYPLKKAMVPGYVLR